MVPLIRSELLGKIAGTAKDLGADVADMFRRVGADLQCMVLPELHVPERWLADMLDLIEQRTGFGAVGLLIADGWRMSDNGPLALLLQHQPTLRHALGQFETYRHLRSEAVTLRVQEAGELAIVRLEVRTERGRAGRQIVELALGCQMTLLRWILGAEWHPKEMRFFHAAPHNLDLHRRVFGCPMEFGCNCDAIVMRRADLNRPNPHGDVNLARYAKELLDSRPSGFRGMTALAVGRNLELLLPQGHYSVADMALQLGTTARTLQRRLAQERTEYSIVLNDVRRSLVIRYLGKSRFPIAQIATLLGFSEASAFSRWFAGQFGQSPRQWRDGRPG